MRATVRAAHALDAAKLDGWIEAMLVLSPPHRQLVRERVRRSADACDVARHRLTVRDT